MNTTLIHFNDIYNVEKSPRFVAAVRAAQRAALGADADGATAAAAAAPATCITVFSGDAFSPSTLSTTLRGTQMVPVLNALGVDCACLGNHDLDFGVREFEALRAQCTFPWICSNVRSLERGAPLGGCQEFVVLERNGLRFLVLGLIEYGWMETLSSVDPADVEFEDYSDYVKRRVPEITSNRGPFDMVIASSHMRMPNDYKLVEECAGLIDVVLGGHDHHYEDTVKENIHILNSGSDFSNFTVLQVNARNDITTERVTITPTMEEDPDILEIVRGFSDEVAKNMSVTLGVTKVDLDARFSEIRTKETNVANLLASILTKATGADISILNAGSIRADRIIPKGEFKVQDLCDLLPSTDSVAVVALTGERLVQVLENGVSRYPAMEGRFPCVDGVRFSFDPNLPPGSRILKDSIQVRHRVLRPDISRVIRRRGENLADPPAEMWAASPLFSPLVPDKTYHVCTKTYLLAGKDGYEAFVGAPVVLDAELCLPLPTLLRNCFTEIAVMHQWEGITTHAVVAKAASKFKRSLRGSDFDRSDVDRFALAPIVDGRITNIQES